jgi:hypothetical protein
LTQSWQRKRAASPIYVGIQGEEAYVRQLLHFFSVFFIRIDFIFNFARNIFDKAKQSIQY